MNGTQFWRAAYPVSMHPWLEELNQGVSVPTMLITGLFPGHLLEGREVPGIAVEEGSFVCSVSFGLNERIDERL